MRNLGSDRAKKKNHVKCVGCKALSDMNLVLKSIYLVFTVYFVILWEEKKFFENLRDVLKVGNHAELLYCARLTVNLEDALMKKHNLDDSCKIHQHAHSEAR